MKTLLKTIAFCCALAIGATGAASDVLAGPGGGGKDKVEKNSGRGNQNKDWEHGGGGHGDKDIGRGGPGGKNDNILDGHVNDLGRAGITLEAARQLALGGGYTGYKPLPPGIVKNLARGKPLPPGIAKRMVPGGMLPPGLTVPCRAGKGIRHLDGRPRNRECSCTAASAPLCDRLLRDLDGRSGLLPD